MQNKPKRTFIFLVIGCLFLTQSALSETKKTVESFQTRDALATIVYSGVGGAVLGLSTLSFVSQPSDHLKNILIGGALGIIVGVGYVAYMAATEPSSPINENLYNSSTRPKSNLWEYHEARGEVMSLLGSSKSQSGHAPLYVSMGFQLPSL